MRYKLAFWHQIAHRWFYAMVGDDQFLEPWLDEGFAEIDLAELRRHAGDVLVEPARQQRDR